MLSSESDSLFMLSNCFPAGGTRLPLKEFVNGVGAACSITPDFRGMIEQKLGVFEKSKSLISKTESSWESDSEERYKLFLAGGIVDWEYYVVDHQNDQGEQ